jgi:hypothetical protein
MKENDNQKKSPNQELFNPPASPVCYMDQFPEYFGFSETEQIDQKKSNIPSADNK